MRICWNKRKCLRKKRFNSLWIGLEHQYGCRFIDLEHQYGCSVVMCKRYREGVQSTWMKTETLGKIVL